MPTVHVQIEDGGHATLCPPYNQAARSTFVALVVTKFEDVGAFPAREQACLAVEIQLGAGIGDIEKLFGRR